MGEDAAISPGDEAVVTVHLTAEEVQAVLDNWTVFATRRHHLNSGSGLARTCAKVARALLASGS